jgi:murein DD-endopeptidase MepM/ murein hydrolase activator NlpD
VSLVDCFREDGSGCDRNAASALDGGGAKRNLLCLEHEADFVSCYLHLKKALVRRGARVARGDALGVVGRTGTARAHLHLALSDLPEPNEPGAFSDLTTIPLVFRDYEASSDFGRSWQHVEAGTPRVYQWVRRAH